MNHTLAKQVARWTCNLVAGVSLPLLVLLLSSGQTSAQTSANGTMAPPARYASMASQIGVTAYPLNKWNDAGAAAVIQQAINSMQPSIVDGSASLGVVFRYNYYSRVHQSIVQNSVAAEIAIIRDLKLSMDALKGTFPRTQLPAVYAEMVTLLN